MTEKERMLAGKLYIPQDKELGKDFEKSRRLTRMFNATTEHDVALREQYLKELFASTKKHLYIEPPFHCDYGCHIHIGDNFYANYDCIMIDVCDITIGNNVFLAPRVGLYTAGHPIDAEVRDALLEYGKPINIGNSVWIGANTVVNPGVNIGNNVVIGSGSVVVKDIPDNVVAAGNPCKVIREITNEDKEYWIQLREEYYQDQEVNTL